MDAKLIITGGKANRSEVTVKLPAIVGRGSDADLTLAHPMVSRHHCKLLDVDGAVVLHDNGSTNGTYIGKKRVTKDVLLKPGDSFSIGPITFRTEYEHSGSFPKVGGSTHDDDATPNPEMGEGGGMDFAAETESAPTADLSDLTEAFQSEQPAAKKAAPSKPAAKPEKKAAPAKPAAKSEKAKSENKAAEPSKREQKPAKSTDDDALGWMTDEPAAAEADESPLADLAEEDGVPLAEADEPAPQAAPAAASAEDEDDLFGDPASEEEQAADDELEFDLSLNDDAEAADGSEEDTTEMMVVKRPDRNEPVTPVSVKAKKSEPPPEEPADDEIEFAEAGEAAELDFFSDEPNAAAPAEAAEAEAEAEEEEPEESPRASHKPAKPAPGKKSDAKKGGDKKGGGWWPFGGKSAKKEKPTSKSKASHKSEPEPADEPAAEPEPAPKAKPKAADPPRKHEPAAAKKAEPKKAPAKPAAKPVAAADEPDFDFVGGGDDAPTGAKNDDDDFFRDLGLE